MAVWDTADLLARCKRDSGVPATTEFPDDTAWYQWLSDAQQDDLDLMATHCPESQYGAPQLLTTSDSGATYAFPANEWPVGRIELRASRNGRLLVVGAEWDAGVDFVFEQNTLRVPGGKTKTYADGPYARYMSNKTDAVIDASTEPVLQPAWARRLTVLGAVARWARRGGRRDPRPFEAERQRIIWGPRGDGSDGLIAKLKTQYQFQGAAAISFESQDRWWAGIDDGSGYPTPS